MAGTRRPSKTKARYSERGPSAAEALAFRILANRTGRSAVHPDPPGRRHQQ